MTHFDLEAIGHLSIPSESHVIELPNACFSFEIEHPWLKLFSLKLRLLNCVSWLTNDYQLPHLNHFQLYDSVCIDVKCVVIIVYPSQLLCELPEVGVVGSEVDSVVGEVVSVAVVVEWDQGDKHTDITSVLLLISFFVAALLLIGTCILFTYVG